MKLYNYWRSSASYRVRLALEYKGLGYEYVPVHLVREGGAQFSAAYRKLNPQSRVPTLEVDGAVITQSLAIIEWLEESHPAPALLPADTLGRARVRSLTLLIAADIQPLQNIAVTRYLKDVVGVGEAGIRDWYREWVGRGLAAFEARLDAEPATGKFCHGDTLTVADLCLVAQCYAARRTGVDLAGFPNILRIDARCAELPAVLRAAPERQPDAEG
jgi:maleylpyruvate isomerase